MNRWYKTGRFCCDIRACGYDACRGGCSGPDKNPLGRMARAASTGCTGAGGSKLTDFFTDRELTEALIDLNQGVLLSMRDCTALDAAQAGARW